MLTKTKIELYDELISPRECYCSLCGLEASCVEDPYVNLYIKFSGCNAKCEFCEDDCKTKPFDLDKLKKILPYLKDRVKVRKVSFTGGEPTLDMFLLEEVYAMVKESFPDAFTVINTNGFDLVGLFESKVLASVDSVSLSRHHYTDHHNGSVFGTRVKVATTPEICQITRDDKNAERLHFSCNLIKGYIESPYEIIKYLEAANGMNVHDVGFVSLMMLNEYCVENAVGFDAKAVTGLTQIKSWEYKESCECQNYLYLPKNFYGKPVKVYRRNPKKPLDFESLLTYDGDKLRIGFDGKVLT